MTDISRLPASRPDGSRTTAIAERYDGILIDLDGVLFLGNQVIPSAPSTVARLRDRGLPVLFLTNNATRPPGEVAVKLEGLGIPARETDVMTSAMATAAMLRGENADGASAFVIGERGIREALQAIGIRILDGEPDRADLVVVGLDRGVDYPKLRTAATLVERGARLIGTNPDGSFPGSSGLWPGAGAILAAVTATTGASAIVVGKPGRPMFEAAAAALSARNPLVVGDRLDTDVSGATAMGWDSLMVLTGISTPADLVRADHLPKYVGTDVSAVLGHAPPGLFRPAAATDAASIRTLLEAVHLSSEGVDERIASTIVCDSREGSSLGPPILVATACVLDERGTGILRSVAVAPDMRGMGVGMLAVAEAARLARRQGIGRLALFTESAAGFFERLGFQAVPREDLPARVRESAHAREDCAKGAEAMIARLTG